MGKPIFEDRPRMVKDSSIPVYTISAASEMTGVPATTLRYWESVYGLVHPMRAMHGHRLYSAQDVEKIRWLKDRIEKDNLRPREAHMLLAQKLAREGELRSSQQPKHAVMILIAEKDPLTAGLEEFFLGLEGYDVLLVFDARLALPEAEEKQPDLIVLDLILPGMSGIKVCEALKANDRTSHIPVLVLSILDVRDKALAAGADAFLLKPVSQPEMIDAVKNMLASEMPGSARKD